MPKYNTDPYTDQVPIDHERRITALERDIRSGRGDTVWINTGFWPGWISYIDSGTPPSSYGPVQFRKLNGVVHLRGLAIAQAGATSMIFTLPLELAPGRNTIVPCAVINGASYLTMQLWIDGSIGQGFPGLVQLIGGPPVVGEFVSLGGISFPTS